MQAQLHHSSKKNKVTVPFYSPSYRLYEQTSSDIIKEARAAVMVTSPVGIKPVFTSRPFTPNQAERTLFGNRKKSKSRPPSSFSLRPVRCQEPRAGIKLPSIEIVSGRKDHPTFHFSKNLSLDNLTEDYDAEVFEEFMYTEAKKLPTWKKSHSCPKEGRLSKVASMNDISHSFADVNNSSKEENLPSNKGNLKLYQCDYDLKESSLFGDTVNFEQNIIYSKQHQKKSVMTKGGGDFEVSHSSIEKLFNNNFKHERAADDALLVGNMYEESDQKTNKSEDSTIGSEKMLEPYKSNSKEIIIQEKSAGKIELEEGVNETQTEQKEIVETEVQEKVVETKAEHIDFQENQQFFKNKNVAEKSIVTGFKSEYLMALKTGYKTTEIIKQPKAVPLEILELYETARYYEVDMNKNDSTLQRITASTNNPSAKAEEKLNNNVQSKENLKKYNKEKENGVKEKLQHFSSENLENEKDKKQYHTSISKNGATEKTYKKWNSKQEFFDTDPEVKVSNDGWDLFWKNSYYQSNETVKEKSKKDTDREILHRLISRITGFIKKGLDNKELYEVTSEFYNFLKDSKIALDSKLKEGILRVLYAYIDNENAAVLLSLAKIFFYLKEENCLSVACKIIFKVARLDTNDDLFLKEEDILELFLEGIGRSSPLECAESCIYSYGALKFLTLNHTILSKILYLGALDLMTLHLKIINNAYAENRIVGEQTQHVLFQLTGALRHIAAGEGALPLFLTTNCVAILCDTLRLVYKDEDVIINISRTLSLLSTDEIVIQALMQVDNILPTVIDLIERFKENDKILIRLAFCLGNIVEHNDLARVQLSRSDASLTVLLNVLKLYIDKDLEISLNKDSNTKADGLSPEVVDDVIVKVIRIIANMSMNPIVGSNLSPATKEKKSLQLSRLLSILLMRKDPGITLLATLGCLNNISYYCNTHSALIDITQGVERVLGLESVECQIESARVLGNLTRHREIRDLIYSTGGIDLLIKLLSSPDQEVVKCACGALVNMMLDSESRKSFVKAQGIDKLVSALEIFPNDWSLASLATRAIWNSCGDDVSSAMLHNHVEYLLGVLANLLEEENWNDGDVTWEEFASVATDLLEKINSHLESAEKITCITTNDN